MFMFSSEKLISMIMVFVIMCGNRFSNWFISGVMVMLNILEMMDVLKIFGSFMLGFMLMVIMGVIVVNVIFIIIGRWILKIRKLSDWMSVLILVVNRL